MLKWFLPAEDVRPLWNETFPLHQAPDVQMAVFFHYRHDYYCACQSVLSQSVLLLLGEASIRTRVFVTPSDLPLVQT